MPAITAEVDKAILEITDESMKHNAIEPYNQGGEWTILILKKRIGKLERAPVPVTPT